MRSCGLFVALALFVASPCIDGARLFASLQYAGGNRLPILVRPGMLAAQIGELAGQAVRVPSARVVGVMNPRVFLVDTATRLPPVIGHRLRVVVLTDPGMLNVPESLLVASTVTIVGVARTVLGMQVAREVPWPRELNAESIERLEIKAAILASSVQTAEGIELVIADSSRSR